MVDWLYLANIIGRCSYRVAPSTMYAIIKTESKGKPWTININGHIVLKHQPYSYKQAVLWVDYLEAHNYNIDIGLTQVNIKNIHKMGFKAHDLLEQCRNISIGSWLLYKNYLNALLVSNSQAEALQKALSAYNTGDFYKGLSNGYVDKVFSNAVTTFK